MSLLEVSGLKKVYKTRFGGNAVEALRNVNFSVNEGEYVAIMGEIAARGKTTLLNILAALDKPTAGTVLLDGQDFRQDPRERGRRVPPRPSWASCFRSSTCWTRSRLRTTSISRSSSRARATMRCARRLIAIARDARHRASF